MNPTEVLGLLERRGALRTGHFKLSSGLHSDTYVQCAQVLQWPHIAERLGHELGTRFAASEATVVLGPAMGGVIIAHEVARYLDVRMIFTERVDADMTLRRGFNVESSDRVLVAEDVVSTGRSQKEAIDLVTSGGAECVGVAAIVDRSTDVSFGVPFHALAEIEANAWDAQGCPLCEQGVALDVPGSRHLVR